MTFLPPSVGLLGQSNAGGSIRPNEVPNWISIAYPPVMMTEQTQCPTDGGVGSCAVDSGWHDLEPRTAPTNRLGPELTLCRRLYEDTQIPFELIKSWESGTNLNVDWNAVTPGGAYMYPRSRSYMMRRTGRLWAVFWIQGEGDTANDAAAIAYPTNLGNLILALRRDIDPDLVFIMVRLNIAAYDDVPARAARVPIVRAGMENVARNFDRTAYVDVDDLPLGPDRVHYDDPNAVMTIGFRLGDKALQLGGPL